ncbi:MAG: class I SAM-dependent methyltransferase [Solirubrobacterales bacterium]|nr:class I SAM-dependent methyltransferase [Solirubrobacterales bacterium]
MLRSQDGTCRYPVLHDVPILINEQRSVFRISDYRAADQDGAARTGVVERILAGIDGRLPSLSRNVGSDANYRQLARLMGDKQRPRVLIVGGRIAGVGFDALLDDPNVDCIDVDAALGPRTSIVCDAHDLPFRDSCFDGVVCQAVLEHVLDPVRVVSEIHRVLVPDGLVYSEIPFMYPQHGAPYDFTRFTMLGHRRLYRWFDELQTGVQCGPGMALGFSLVSFLRALPRSRLGRAIATRAGALLFFWLKYLDDWLVSHPSAREAAGGTFFLGRRRSEPLADDALILADSGTASAAAGADAPGREPLR